MPGKKRQPLQRELSRLADQAEGDAHVAIGQAPSHHSEGALVLFVGDGVVALGGGGIITLSFSVGVVMIYLINEKRFQGEMEDLLNYLLIWG